MSSSDTSPSADAQAEAMVAYIAKHLTSAELAVCDRVGEKNPTIQKMTKMILEYALMTGWKVQ